MINPLDPNIKHEERPETPEKIPEQLVSPGGEYDIEKISIARSLGINDFKEMKQYDEQLHRLARWAKMKGAKDSLDIVWNIKQLASRIGGPSFGQHNVQNLSIYAGLELERNRIENKMKDFSNA